MIPESRRISETPRVARFLEAADLWSEDLVPTRGSGANGEMSEVRLPKLLKEFNADNPGQALSEEEVLDHCLWDVITKSLLLEFESIADQDVVGWRISSKASTTQMISDDVITADDVLREIERETGCILAGIDLEDIAGNDTLKPENFLLLAVVMGHADNVSVLLDENPGIVDRTLEAGHKHSMLSFAASEGDLATMDVLIEKGADINHQDIKGWTPLMHAVAVDQLEAAQRLVSCSGLDIDRIDHSGRTALHEAVEAVNLEEVALLLNAGADPSITDFEGLTAADFAELSEDRKSMNAIVDLFRQRESGVVLADLDPGHAGGPKPQSGGGPGL